LIHQATVAFHGDLERALDFAANELTSRGFKVEARARDELRASFAARVPVAGAIVTLVLMRGRPGGLELEVRISGVDELQRWATRVLLWLSLALFALQGTAFTFVFKGVARLHAIGTAAALVVFFVVLWLFFGPRIFRTFDWRIRRELERLLDQAAAAGEGHSDA
jgi:hypothetical protein